MYDDFKLCGKEEFEEIAKEYYNKNKAEILSLSTDNLNIKEELKDVLNLSKNLYFALKQREIGRFDNILKKLKNANINLANTFKNKFREEYVPDTSSFVGEINIEYLVNIIKRLIPLLKQDNLDALRQNICDYLDIIPLFFRL